MGTFRKTTGAIAIKDCQACPSGFACKAGTVSSSSKCKAGFYCPSKFTNPFGGLPALIGSYGVEQIPCPGGTFRSTEGAGALKDCTNCSAGSFCGLASTKQSSCPQGFFCPDNCAEPQPCPLGTFGEKPSGSFLQMF